MYFAQKAGGSKFKGNVNFFFWKNFTSFVRFYPAVVCPV